MILLLNGTPGIGKSSIASEIQLLTPAVYHIEMDKLREKLGADTTTNPVVEDAINWKAYEIAEDHMRKYQFGMVIIDSTGISRRIPYLRNALARYEQKVVRLISSFPYAKCTSKWGTAYSQEQFDHLNQKVTSLSSDYTVRVDSKTAREAAQEILRLLAS